MKTISIFFILLCFACMCSVNNVALGQNYTWSNVAMGGGGFVSGIITSKRDPNVVYARTDVGGAYRWDNANSKWIPLLDWISTSQGGYMGVESIAIDPNNSAIVYMLAGTIYTNNGSTAILKSTDNGANFTVLDVTSQFKAHGNGSGRGNGERLQVDPNNSNILWCGTRQNGLFKSIDAGMSWTRDDALPITTTLNYYSGIGTGITFVLLDPASGTPGNASQNMYVGVATVDSTYNLYLSKDGGTSFTPIPVTGGPNPRLVMPARAALASNGSLYITYNNLPGPGNEVGNSGAIWKYNTISSEWTKISPAGLAFGGVSVDPKNPLRVIVSTANTYKPQYVSLGGVVYGDRFYLSADGGTTWRNLIPTNSNNVNITLDPNGIPWITGQSIHWASSIEFNPFNTNQAWANSGNGVFFCNDLSANLNTWKFVAQGIEESVPNDMISIPGGPMFSVIGDYDGFKHIDPSQYPTTGRYSPSTGTTNGIAYASLNTNKLVRVGGNMYYSNDQGISWTQTATNKGSNGKVALSADGSIILHSPGNTSLTTYFSIDNGTTWTACKGLSVSYAIPVADPVIANKFYAYNNNNGSMYVSTDGGANFLSAGSPGTNGAKLIRTVPGNSGHLWLAMGYGLKRSIDGGNTFTTLNSVSACSSVGIGKAASGASYYSIYIWGTVNGITGIFRSIDEGVSWTRVNDDRHQYGGAGNGQFVMGDMNVYGRVYMSTAGRGIAYGEAPFVASNFYSKSTGSLDVLTNWGTNKDGTGTNPSDFLSSGQVFNIVNQSSPTIAAAWTVGGTGSKIVVGNGSNAINFTIPASFATIGTIDATNSSILTIQNSSVPTMGSLATGSIVVFNGSATQAIPKATYDVITVNNSAGCTLGGNISVATNLNLTAGQLALGSNIITLLSTSTNTASVPTIGAGTLSYGTGAFAVQRYLPGGRRAFRFLGHPFNTAIPLSQLTSAVDITGAGGSANGFTITGSNNPSAFYYDATIPDWTAFANTTASSWGKWQGIRIIARGALGEGLNGETPVSSNPATGQYVPSAVTLSMSGQINTGSQTVPLTYTAGTTTYNLVSNPYPSPIDVSKVSGSNISSAYYVWDATITTVGQPRGAYVANQFTDLSNIIPTGAAFFVAATSASPTVTFLESNKSNSTPISLFGSGNSNNKLELLLKEDGIADDRILVNFRTDAIAAEDYWDGEKLNNPVLNFYTLSADNHKLSIDSRFSGGGADTIQLIVDGAANGNYTIEASPNTSLINKTIFLHDKMLKLMTTLKAGIIYNFAVTSETSSQGNRFELIVNKASATLTDAPPDVSGIFSAKLISTTINNQCIINITSPQRAPTTVRMVNTIGQIISSMNAGNMSSGQIILPTDKLQSGMYFIEVRSGDNKTVLKAIK